MDYKELLNDERWKKKRDEILHRDGHRCKIKGCCSTKELQVHHYFYIGDTPPWEYSNDCLITLCGFHHRQYHKYLRKTEKQLCLTLQTKGFMLGDLLALSSLMETDLDFTQSLLRTLRDMQNG